MVKTETIPLWYSIEDHKIDFNLVPVPKEIMISLANALKWEYQKRMAADCDEHFRQERAAYIDKVEQANKEKGLNIDARQMFLDFK